ncbi:hypothetical protein B0H11DRAFT_2065397 [Mycena galericulata]|nr:hypothetical protein B0H11DRAFT_2065397 [Mycena galericulata]
MRRIISLSKILSAAGNYPLSPHEHAPRSLRADTPFTSPPLNDDFDAITTQRWSRTTRATTVEPSCSALYEQLEAATRTTTPAGPGFKAPRRQKKKTNHNDTITSSRKQQDGAVALHERSLRRKKRIKSGTVTGMARIGPLAGQDYEIVDHKVLEDGPERTVSISTWREQAIQEADSDDAMSVYYVNAEDCDQLRAPEVVVIPIRTDDSSGSNKSGDGSGARGTETRPAENLASSNGQTNKSPHDFPHRSAGSKEASSTMNSSGPRTSTPRGSGTLVIQNAEGQTNILAGGSSPFHATKSGSTISSIHLSPTPTLEHVLISCEPSLIHISPVLQRIGIMRAEHLRAVGKLSEDTRNKEVKEEVLKLGVTVVEWAILLDKLQSL